MTVDIEAGGTAVPASNENATEVAGSLLTHNSWRIATNSAHRAPSGPPSATPTTSAITSRVEGGPKRLTTADRPAPTCDAATVLEQTGIPRPAAVLVESCVGQVHRPRALVPACLLLLVAEHPGHGYELFNRVRSLGVPLLTRAPVYRYLRMLEAADLVSSELETRASGPCRMVYRPTPAGWEVLHRCAASVGQLLGILNELLAPIRGAAVTQSS